MPEPLRCNDCTSLPDSVTAEFSGSDCQDLNGTFTFVGDGEGVWYSLGHSLTCEFDVYGFDMYLTCLEPDDGLHLALTFQFEPA